MTIRSRPLIHTFLIGLAVSAAGCARAPRVYERTGTVMGTLAQLKVVTADRRAAEDALALAFAELERIEAITTTYSESSEISRLNRAAGPFPVGADLHRVLALAREIAERTDGAFDPTAGALIELWGFADTPALPDSSAIDSARAAVGWRRLVPPGTAVAATATAAAGSPPSTIWDLAPPRPALDLGGIAKGYAVDRAADLLAARFGRCLVNAGGDLAVRGVRPDGDGWLIGVQDPRDPSRLFLRLRVEGETAVATSGDYQRYFEVGGVRYHHILDPRTGWPARGVRSATAIAGSCAEADAWATAAFVLGVEAGLAKLEEEPGVEGVLVEEDAAGELVLHATSGFDAYRVP